MRTDYDFARTIDSTLLRVDASRDEMLAHFELAKKCHFKTVAIHNCWVEDAAKVVAGSDVGICAGAGFPNGASTTDCKIFETIDVFAKGATECDLRMNSGWLKGKQYDLLAEEFDRFVKACGKHVSKVIIETCFLTDNEIREAIKLIKDAGFNFVKTSTGFAAGGATLEHVKLMVAECGDSGLQVKASGGVRTREFAEELLDAGATRLGMSHAHKLLSSY